MADDDEEMTALFDECKVVVIPSNALPEGQAEKISSTLQANGADIIKIKRSNHFDLDSVTHIIAANADFPLYNEAMDRMLCIVTPQWVTLSLLKNKLAPVRPFNPDPRMIFTGVSLTTADLPVEDKDAIIGAVLAMGGQETESLTKTTTHIVALTMEHEKVKQAQDKRVRCKFVLPHWFDDCLKLGKRIDEGPYTLPDPEILSKGPEDEIAIPSSQHLEGAITVRPNFASHPMIPPNRKLDVFDDKRIMLAEDLQLTARLRGIIEELVTTGGGAITNVVQRADILVCHYRDGTDYIFASQKEIDVGNLSWLYHLITNNQWTSPFKRLLHYPVPRAGIPGFKDFRITLSNYGGEARMYLENLVLAAGGEFTKSMKAENTHLITARIASEKCNAAQEWNINMINHLWLEESYAKCAIQPLTNPKYTHFPPRTNLGEVIGQTQFDRQALQDIYFPLQNPESPERLNKQRSAMQDKDSNASFLRADTSDDLPSPVTAKKPRATPARAAPRISTPLPSRLAGKENETPSSTSSRGAKDRAISKLSDLATDVALYDKERKRSGNGVWGGKRAADQMEKEKDAQQRERDVSRKRSSSAASEGEEEEAIEKQHEAKKQKKGRTPLPVTQMRILITSYARWVEKVGLEEADRRKLRALGILVSQDPHTCTHLVAPSIIRTQKFLTALASGCVLLSSAFIDTCLEKDEIPPVDKFLLKDTVNEKRWNIKLKDVLTRAKDNRKRLLHNVVVYCTADIPNGPDTYKAIVEANGGIFSIYRGRGGTTIRASKEGEEDPTDGDPVYLLTGPKPEEKRLWPKFEQMVTNGKMEPRIVATEWILYTAMAQEMVWKKDYLMKQP